MGGSPFGRDERGGLVPSLVGGLAIVLAVGVVLGVVAPLATAGGASTASSPILTAGGSSSRSSPIAGGASGDDVSAGVAEVPGRDPVEPNLTVEPAVPQAEAVTATLSLPSRAESALTFRVRLEATYDSPAAVRTVTLDPGEQTLVDFGDCLPAGSYTIRVLNASSEVLVAAQTSVLEPANRLSFDDDDADSRTETVRLGGELTLRASLHECVDRATFVLRSADGDGTAGGEDGARWRATVVDADGDGDVTLRWDVDAAVGAQLGTSAGDRLANVTERDSVDGYGEFVIDAVVADESEATVPVTVSFADPDVSIYAVEGSLTPGTAIDVVASNRGPDLAREQVPAGDWVVVRIDTDGTVETLQADETLLAPARHENATIQVQPFLGGVSEEPTELDLANATRRFDRANGTIWYAVRATADVDRTRIRYVAIGPTVNATDAASVTVAPKASLSLPQPALLAPTSNVTIDGWSALRPGTTLTVSVLADDAVLARETVAVSEDGDFDATLDLSNVGAPTNATVVVAENGSRLDAAPVRIAAESRVRLVGLALDELSPRGENDVGVIVENRGTVRGEVEVTLEVGDAAVTRTVAVDPGSGRVVTVTVPARGLELEERVVVRARAGDDVITRLVPVDQPGFPDANDTTTVATTTEPWPTLVGSRDPQPDSPIPGAGALGALAALALTTALVARRALADP